VSKQVEIAKIYEDNHVIVVIKPQNVPCCPDESGDANLLDELKMHLGEGEKRTFVGLVHRLDRVTGGVMVYAKTSKAAARLAEQLQNNTFHKKYLAVVLGEPKLREKTLVDHLLKDELKNTTKIVPSATTGAKRAELNYRVTQIIDKVSLVEVQLVTGRSHQIRVQMANHGYPVFGDAKYGGDKLGKGWNLALWAYEIAFVHPTTQDMMKFIVNPPETIPWTKFEIDRKVKQASKGAVE